MQWKIQFREVYIAFENRFIATNETNSNWNSKGFIEINKKIWSYILFIWI